MLLSVPQLIKIYPHEGAKRPSGKVVFHCSVKFCHMHMYWGWERKKMFVCLSVRHHIVVWGVKLSKLISSHSFKARGLKFCVQAPQPHAYQTLMPDF